MPSTGLPLLHQSVPDNARRLGNSCWDILLVVEGCVVSDGSVGGVETTKGCMEKGELVTGRTKRANRHRISMGWLVGCVFFRCAAPLVGLVADILSVAFAWLVLLAKNETKMKPKNAQNAR